jgi:hypothetical protein
MMIKLLHYLLLASITTSTARAQTTAADSLVRIARADVKNFGLIYSICANLNNRNAERLKIISSTYVCHS